MYDVFIQIHWQKASISDRDPSISQTAWPLGLGRDPRQVPPLAVLPVHQRRVLRHPVVPHDDGALLPLDSGLEVGALAQVLVQEGEQGIRFFLLQADNIACDCPLVSL